MELLPQRPPLFGPTVPVLREAIQGRAKTGAPARRQRAYDSRRVGMEHTLRWQQIPAARSASVAGAALGLEFTQPFHDKRVVEFGLAIPEALYVKNGRRAIWRVQRSRICIRPNSRIVRRATTIWGRTFLLMAKRIEPRVLAEIDRMEKAADCRAISISRACAPC